MVNKKIIGVSLGVLFLTILIYFLGFFGLSFNNISGNAILDLSANYQEGQPLEGALILSLKEGELIPASSKILFKTPEKTEEYDLTEFITDDLIEGNFYLEGQSISGNGLGYGVMGKKPIYPKVDFTLNIHSPKSEGNANQLEETTGDGIVEEETPESTEIEESETIEETESVENEIIEETTELEEAEEIEENIKESESEEADEEPAQEAESTAEAPAEEEIPEKDGDNIVTNILETVANFFLGLTPTGKVSLEFATEISGEVSANEPFTYFLKKGQTAEIVSSSQNIELNIQGNEVIVTTDYSEIEHGFGEDYLKDIQKEIVIDLSPFGLMVEEGDLEITLVYDEEEIVSLITPSEETQNPILPEIKEEGIANALSDTEKEILFEKFGNSSIKIVKAESSGDRIVIRYELGEYWFEPSYDSGLKDNLNSQIEEDRVRWLQDIANTLLQEEVMPEEIEINEKEIKIF
ncbi:hypothetical protein KAR52_02450 [Candidatus Pacearchaeota archaeon]|nr:hypothetical protein [Candidatus Pacearchaeota archaeon]